MENMFMCEGLRKGPERQRHYTYDERFMNPTLLQPRHDDMH